MKNEELIIKSVSICGFRSFTEPCRIEFSSGINIITDPLEKGAADLLKVIGWVLKTDESLEDLLENAAEVLFCGNDLRPAANEAYVIVRKGYAENDEHNIELKRTINSNDEYHYFLNEKEVSCSEWENTDERITHLKLISLFGDFEIPAALTGIRLKGSGAMDGDFHIYAPHLFGSGIQDIVACNNRKLISFLKPKRIIGIAREEPGISKIYNIQFEEEFD